LIPASSELRGSAARVVTKPPTYLTAKLVDPRALLRGALHRIEREEASMDWYCVRPFDCSHITASSSGC